MGIREVVETDFNDRSRIGRSTAAVNDELVKQFSLWLTEKSVL